MPSKRKALSGPDLFTFEDAERQCLSTFTVPRKGGIAPLRFSVFLCCASAAAGVLFYAA
jgi:hypothetical protein